MISVFTSMDENYYNRIGLVMINSFLEKWPENIRLTIYWEKIETVPNSLKKQNDRIEILDLENITNLNLFRERNKDRPGNTPTALERGANRFAPKGYSIIHQLFNPKSTFNIWLDADVRTHSNIDDNFFESIIEPKYITSYLGRDSYTETGFITFHNQHVGMKRFREIYRQMYDNDLLFQLPLWHDCLVFDVARLNTSPHLNLSTNGKGYGHVFINSILGKYMDHMKGPRKDRGRSEKSESNHNLEYWNET